MVRPKVTEFLDIMLRDKDGNFHILDYQMVETSEGWQINGVQLLQAPDVGA